MSSLGPFVWYVQSRVAPMTISPKLKQAAELAGGEPLRLTDPETDDAYYLVKADVFDRLRRGVDDGPDRSDVGIFVDAAMREDDASDPLLEGYQKYRS